jgi:hypothetical protein
MGQWQTSHRRQKLDLHAVNWLADCATYASDFNAQYL